MCTSTNWRLTSPRMLRGADRVRSDDDANWIPFLLATILGEPDTLFQISSSARSRRVSGTPEWLLHRHDYQQRNFRRDGATGMTSFCRRDGNDLHDGATGNANWTMPADSIGEDDIDWGSGWQVTWRIYWVGWQEPATSISAAPIWNCLKGHT